MAWFGEPAAHRKQLRQWDYAPGQVILQQGQEMESVRSSKQLGRGGAMTMFYPCLDPEVETLLKLKNVKTPLDKRINLIDYGFRSVIVLLGESC